MQELRDERLAIGQDSDVMVTFLATPDVQQAFDVLVANIGRALDDRAELSVFARRIVASHCTKPWTNRSSIFLSGGQLV